MPGLSAYNPSWYCSEAGFVECEAGFDLDPEYYGPIEPVGQTCPASTDAAGADAGGLDAGSFDRDAATSP